MWWPHFCKGRALLLHELTILTKTHKICLYVFVFPAVLLQKRKSHVSPREHKNNMFASHRRSKHHQKARRRTYKAHQKDTTKSYMYVNEQAKRVSAVLDYRRKSTLGLPTPGYFHSCKIFFDGGFGGGGYNHQKNRKQLAKFEFVERRRKQSSAPIGYL